MARSSSISTGVGVLIAVLSLATLTLFVLTLVFVGQKQTAEQQLAAFRQETDEIIRASERNLGSVRTLIDSAKRDNRSLVGALTEQFGDISQLVSGSRGDSLTSLKQRVEGALRPLGGSNLISTLADQRSSLARSEQRARDAEAAAAAARSDLENQNALVRQQGEQSKTTIDALNAQVRGYRQELETFRGDVQEAVETAGAEIERTTREAGEQRARDADQIARLGGELAAAQARLRELQGTRPGERLVADPEFALVDGQVTVVDNAAGDVVFINRGRRDRVFLGQTFEVYSDGSQVRPVPVLDPRTGQTSEEFPPGKAAIEIIAIEDATSRARVVRPRARGVGSRAHSIAQGDVIVNAVYDPAKVYRFLIAGDFNLRGGTPTPLGRDDVRALITQWGGQVVETLSGEVDFVVLGERPVVPPQPAGTASTEVISFFVQKQNEAGQYERFLREATGSEIPILNQNRLLTLTGQAGLGAAFGAR